MTFSLGADPAQTTAAHAARLYVLLRDAYLAPPAMTLVKLASLETLRSATDERIMLGDSSGVALIDRLRSVLHRFSSELDASQRAAVLVDVLASTAPAPHVGWTRSPVDLVADAGAYLAPEVSPSTLHRLARTHRATRRISTVLAGVGLPPRAVLPCATGAEVAVSHMLSSVLGLCPAAARTAALVLIDGGALDDETPLAGGLALQPVTGFSGPDAYVATTLARVDPLALVHQLSTLECLIRWQGGLKGTIATRLEAVREDIAVAEPGDAEEDLRLRVGARAVEISVLRIGAGERGRLGALASRRHLPRRRDIPRLPDPA